MLHYCRSYFIDRSRNRRRSIFIHFYVRRRSQATIAVNRDREYVVPFNSISNAFSIRYTFCHFSLNFISLQKK